MKLKLNNDKIDAECIVIGGNHHNTLGVVRSLGYKGVNSHLVLVTDNSQPYVRYSTYVHQFVILTAANEIVDYLLKIKDVNKKSVVISCADFVTAVLDSHQDELSSYYYLPVGKGNIEQIMSKDKMAKIANEFGILTPSIISLDRVRFDKNQRFIFKPLKSIEGSKSDIAVVSNSQELQHYLESSHCGNLQIQEFIEKDIEFQLIGCSLNAGETVIIPGVSIILRQPKNTNTGFLKYIEFQEFDYNGINECKQFIKAIGYSGLFSMEFLRGKDGKDYFMEINMRNDGNSICVTAAGVNLPYIWYSHCIGTESWRDEATNSIRNIIVMPEFDDFVNVLKRNISLWQWFKDIRRTDHFMEYDKTDKRPFFIGLRQQFFNYGKLILFKLHIIK